MSTNWRDNAACAGMDTELFYPAGPGDLERIQAAEKVCADCPVQAECLEEAMRGFECGVWGGLTEQSRRTARRRRQLTGRKTRSETEPRKRCGKCAQTRPLSDFHRTHVGGERRDSQCRLCKAAAKRGGRPPGDGLPNDGITKWCSACEVRKPVIEFSSDSRRADRLKSQCRACLNAASAVRKRRMRARRAALAGEERLTG